MHCPAINDVALGSSPAPLKITSVASLYSRDSHQPRRPSRTYQGIGSISPPRQATLSLHSTSSPIRLPKTHIHRTPSEIQLAQERIKADYCERQMYARLVYGMSHHCEDKQSEMHPLTIKSLRGVVQTHKQGNQTELDDWKLCYKDHDDDMYIEDQVNSSVVSHSDEENDCLFDLEM